MATIVSDGRAEDTIRAIQQLVCSEGHYKTLVEKYHSEMENGIIDVENDEERLAHIEKLNGAIEEMNLVAELRRSMMLKLMESYPKSDTSYWCLVKHLSAASYCAFEAYQASDNDAMLLNLYLESHARFVNAVTRWLGVEITSCASCYQDALKGVSHGE